MNGVAQTGTILDYTLPFTNDLKKQLAKQPGLRLEESFNLSPIQPELLSAANFTEAQK